MKKLSRPLLQTNEFGQGEDCYFVRNEVCSQSLNNPEFYHQPVMLKECIEGLNINPEGVYVDCTLGGAGHSIEIANKLNERGVLHAFDRDEEALSYGKNRLQFVKPKVIFHPVNFGNLKEEIGKNSIDGIIYDLGISSHQVDDATRGFTFAKENPIDLRMDKRQEISAQQWLRNIEENEFAEILKSNADLERGKKLAKKILENIKNCIDEEIYPSDIQSAVEFVYRDKKRDLGSLMARVFQAIRMDLNDELNEIEKSLEAAVDCLTHHGRLVVMSYHSVEDRKVKETLLKYEKNCICPENLPICVCGGNHKKLIRISKKIILPSEEEIRRNSRARSAKLRIYEKV